MFRHVLRLAMVESPGQSLRVLSLHPEPRPPALGITHLLNLWIIQVCRSLSFATWLVRFVNIDWQILTRYLGGVMSSG
jgi:hypothetical protein